MHAWEYCGVLPNPHIIANNSIAFERQVFFRGYGLVPRSENIKRVSRYGVHLVVCPVHHKLYTCTNLAEFTDNEFIANKIIMVRNVFLKVSIRKISKIAYNDIRIFNRRFYKCKCVNIR